MLSTRTRSIDWVGAWVATRVRVRVRVGSDGVRWGRIGVRLGSHGGCVGVGRGGTLEMVVCVTLLAIPWFSTCLHHLSTSPSLCLCIFVRCVQLHRLICGCLISGSLRLWSCGSVELWVGGSVALWVGGLLGPGDAESVDLRVCGSPSLWTSESGPLASRSLHYLLRRCVQIYESAHPLIGGWVDRRQCGPVELANLRICGSVQRLDLFICRPD